MNEILDYGHCTVMRFPGYQRELNTWVRISPMRELYKWGGRYGQGRSPHYPIAIMLAIVTFVAWNYLPYEVYRHLPQWTRDGYF